MDADSRRKRWSYQRVLTEHVFDKVRQLDLTLREFEFLLAGDCEVIESTVLDDGLKEVILLVEWRLPLHVVVIVDDIHREERVVTVYEPDPQRWSAHRRRRR